MSTFESIHACFLQSIYGCVSIYLYIYHILFLLLALTPHYLTPNFDLVNGTDPANNAWLARCLEQAKKESLPKHLVESALRKSIAGQEGEHLLYEGRWKTLFFIIEARSNNRNRTLQDVRLAFKDHQGQLYDQPGHVRWMFHHRGVIETMAPLTSVEVQRLEEECLNGSGSEGKVFEPSSIPVNKLIEHAIQLGAEDVELISVPTSSVLLTPSTNLATSTSTTLSTSSPQTKDISERLKRQMLNSDDGLTSFQGLQIICEFSQTQTIKTSFDEWVHYGYRPLLLHVGHRYKPDTLTFQNDAVWQDVPESDEEREQVLGLLRRLKELEDVTHVWHNIRGLDPWT